MPSNKKIKKTINNNKVPIYLHPKEEVEAKNNQTKNNKKKLNRNKKKSRPSKSKIAGSTKAKIKKIKNHLINSRHRAIKLLEIKNRNKRKINLINKN